MKSAIICSAIALLSVVIYFYCNIETDPHPTAQEYVSVGTSSFSVCAIIYLFYLMYRHEKKENHEFGAAMRDNAATLVVALLINIIFSAHELVRHFGF